jgi:hypothetical protein
VWIDNQVPQSLAARDKHKLNPPLLAQTPKRDNAHYYSPYHHFSTYLTQQTLDSATLHPRHLYSTATPSASPSSLFMARWNHSDTTNGVSLGPVERLKNSDSDAHEIAWLAREAEQLNLEDTPLPTPLTDPDNITLLEHVLQNESDSIISLPEEAAWVAIEDWPLLAQFPITTVSNCWSSWRAYNPGNTISRYAGNT